MNFWYDKFDFTSSTPVTYNGCRGRWWDARFWDRGGWQYLGRRFYPLGTRRATIILEYCNED